MHVSVTPEARTYPRRIPVGSGAGRAASRRPGRRQPPPLGGVILPVVFILSLEAFRLAFVELGSADNSGHLLLAAVTLCGVVVFAFVMFGAIEATQRQLIRQNRELTAINAVSTAIQGELGLDVIIDAALESVIDSTGATEAIIRVFSPDGNPDGEGGFERRRTAAPHASPQMAVGSLVPHLIDIPLSTGTSVVGRLHLHLPEASPNPTSWRRRPSRTSATSSPARSRSASSWWTCSAVSTRGTACTASCSRSRTRLTWRTSCPRIVRHARELLGADEATMCLSETSSRAIQLDVPAAAAPALTDGTICLSGTTDRFVAQHERIPVCKVRFAADIGPTVEVPIRSPDGPLGDIWLGRRHGSPVHRARPRLPRDAV